MKQNSVTQLTTQRPNTRRSRIQFPTLLPFRTEIIVSASFNPFQMRVSSFTAVEMYEGVSWVLAAENNRFKNSYTKG